MRIDSTPQLGAQAGTAETQAPPGFKDEFLRLLVTQLEHQNPLEPQDGAEFVAQLAQFATVEQGAEANSRLAAIESEQVAAAGAALAGFVGSDATADASEIDWDPARGDAPEMFVDLPEGAETVTVEVTDAHGNVVDTFDLGASKDGEVAFELGDLPAGRYHLGVDARAADGTEIAAATKVRGTVGSVEFGAAGHRLRLGALAIAPADILSIGND